MTTTAEPAEQRGTAHHFLLRQPWPKSYLQCLYCLALAADAPAATEGVAELLGHLTDAAPSQEFRAAVLDGLMAAKRREWGSGGWTPQMLVAVVRAVHASLVARLGRAAAHRNSLLPVPASAAQVEALFPEPFWFGRPALWGPLAWYLAHHVAAHHPTGARCAARAVVGATTRAVPCPRCRGHALELLRAVPLGPGEEDLLAWTWRLREHVRVSHQPGKPPSAEWPSTVPALRAALSAPHQHPAHGTGAG